jgi:hypothetical protein
VRSRERKPGEEGDHRRRREKNQGYGGDAACVSDVRGEGRRRKAQPMSEVMGSARPDERDPELALRGYADPSAWIKEAARSVGVRKAAQWAARARDQGKTFPRLGGVTFGIAHYARASAASAGV